MRESALKLLIAVDECERVWLFAFDLPLPRPYVRLRVGPGEEAGHRGDNR